MRCVYPLRTHSPGAARRLHVIMALKPALPSVLSVILASTLLCIETALCMAVVRVCSIDVTQEVAGTWASWHDFDIDTFRNRKAQPAAGEIFTHTRVGQDCETTRYRSGDRTLTANLGANRHGKHLTMTSWQASFSPTVPSRVVGRQGWC